VSGQADNQGGNCESEAKDPAMQGRDGERIASEDSHCCFDEDGKRGRHCQGERGALTEFKALVINNGTPLAIGSVKVTSWQDLLWS